ncbi:MAG: MBL fold metallo-hydrolase [Clostridia bacterium]|nr:MBL fold metallo-hydrolase [Clostridia bacterium]
MQLTVLGCYGPYAPAGGACSSYLVQNEGFNLMLDCGHGAFSYLQKFINFRELHALVISHFHPDHYADIYAVRQAFSGAFQDGSRTNPLIVYAPMEPKPFFEEISSWRQEFITIPLEDAMLRRNKFGNLKVDFFPTNHPMPCFGVSASVGTCKLTYTADTAWSLDIVEQCADSSLVLAEASLREADMAYTKKGHLTAGQAGSLAQRAKAKKLVLTHFWPEYNPFQLKREAEVTFDGPVELAEMGKTFIVEE